MKNFSIKIVAALTYILMLFVNFLANTLPINNRTTVEISDAYPNLFAPPGLTFSIWGLIYLLLGGYVLYQFISKSSKKKEDILKKINILFIATSIANISWIFAWHYDFIGISMIITTTILILLIKIADILRAQKMQTLEKIFIYAPFSVYFGWITVATIGNVTVFLVSVGWNGFGIADFLWTSIVLLVGMFIGILRMLKDENITYGLVIIWAYLGILIKHLSESGFNKQYPIIINTLIFCILLFVFFVVWLIYKNYSKARRNL